MKEKENKRERMYEGGRVCERRAEREREKIKTKGNREIWGERGGERL